MMKISKNGSFPRVLNPQGVGTVAIRLSFKPCTWTFQKNLFQTLEIKMNIGTSADFSNFSKFKLEKFNPKRR